MPTAVVFDMDGVIVDSEQVWDEVREQLTADWGGRYSPEAQRAMMGMSAPEWSRYLQEKVGLPHSPEEINEEVVRRMLGRYRSELPLIEGAVDAVRALAVRLPHWLSHFAAVFGPTFGTPGTLSTTSPVRVRKSST